MVSNRRITRLQSDIKRCFIGLFLAPSMKRDMSPDFQMVLAVRATSDMPTAQHRFSTSKLHRSRVLILNKCSNHERAADCRTVNVTDSKDGGFFVLGNEEGGIAGVEIVGCVVVVLVVVAQALGIDNISGRHGISLTTGLLERIESTVEGQPSSAGDTGGWALAVNRVGTWVTLNDVN